MTDSSLRVEVKVRASGTCYLSNEPPFCFILERTLFKIGERAVFLEDGFVDIQYYQPLNSNHIIQCFDSETGEQVPVIRQGTQPVFTDSVYSTFTTSSCRDPYELPFITSSLQPDRTYKLCFKPTTSISHWPAGDKDALNSFEKAFNNSIPMPEICPLSKQPVLWEAADGNDTIMFKTRSSQLRPPNVIVSLSAPPICSLSEPFKFTLTFSTDATNPITVLADRSFVKSTMFDISIRNSTSAVSDAPNIHVCGDDDEEDRKDFLRLEETFTEQRELNISDSVWQDLELEVGKEYILRHLSGSWWWTDEPVDEVMTYVESKRSLGLPRIDRIKFASGGEVTFKIVD